MKPGTVAKSGYNTLKMKSSLQDLAGRRKMSVDVYAEDLREAYMIGFTDIQVRKVIGDIVSLDLCPFEGQVLIVQRGGVVQTGVLLKGWMALAQRNGISSIDTEYNVMEDGDVSCTGIVSMGEGTFRRTEFLSECRRPTPIWKQMPKRMLGHRAVIQAIRMACGGCAPVAEELVDDGFSQVGTSETPDAPLPVKDLAAELMEFEDKHKIEEQPTEGK